MCSSCSARQRREYGCDARQDANGEWIDKAVVPMVFDGVETWACPRRPVRDDPACFAELMGLYALYAEGVLADDGAIMSQAVKYVTLMRLVHSVVTECQVQQREEWKKKS
jgi:hypothetical protein